ncbi:DUF748 domain-containing protein [Polymorphobacter arshaanensis]|uniref:DUF748 domain-containing protein n=1 Tax=Glacieibacterium arshaanense TaxID=2511025 RepID=A0A4Y9ESQ4_9SPHN|nr:DUF748 domain-containing protein [Polymorphobacter arshaanensis]TFU06239.1 DUF748 domain-containing protein [Polymorphobacter arshaanensis]
MRVVLRNPFVLIPLILALLFGAYVAAGFWLAPRLIRSAAQDYVSKNLPGKDLALGDIRFNPLRLTLDIDKIAIGDSKAPAPMVAVGHVGVNVSSSSIWKMTPRLDAVSIDAPLVNAVLRKDGTLNLSELVPPDDGKPTPAVWIGRLEVRDGTANFSDQRRAGSREKTLTPITFELRDFATYMDAGGNYQLDAASKDGEAFHWAGTVSMAPLASAGKFSIDALKLTSLYRFIDDLAPVALLGGSLDMAGSYKFAAAPKTAVTPPANMFEANLESLAVADLALRTKDGDDVTVKTLKLAPTQLSLGSDNAAIGALDIGGISARRVTGESVAIDSVALAGSSYKLSAQVADIGALSVKGIAVKGRGKAPEAVALRSIALDASRIDAKAQMARIGAVTVAGLKAQALVAADNSVSIPGLYPMKLPKSAPAADAPAWHYSLAGFNLEDAAVKLTLARVTPAKVLDIAPVKLNIGTITDKRDAPLPVSFSATINRSATISAVGRVDPQTGGAAMALDMAKLPIADFVAFAPTPPGVIVKSGLLGVKGKARITPNAKTPRIDFAGNASVIDLKLLEREAGTDLLAWQRLDVTGIQYAGDRLAIATITLDKPVSNIAITRNAELNIAKVNQTGPTPAPLPISGSKQAIGDVRVKAVMSNTLASAGAAMPIHIGQVVFKNGTIGFSDYSIEPNFRASIQGFSGTITDLSTTPGAQAKFNLKGYVIDRFSPVTITGRANPFAYDANTDITASFKNIELPVFNPYSGQYAGYNISKGKLSTDFHYKISARQLDAQHHVVIDQLEWGAATDSKQKVSLPVRLATSLLKDKNGVIDLDLPVTGSLDDPKFNVWPVVWKVVGNVLTKIITAPFRMLGDLFSSDEQPQFVVFDAGSAALAPDASASLAKLAKGLADKPDVNLDIPAGPGIREDAEAMTTAAIEAAVAGASKKPADYATLDMGEKRDRLAKIYKTKFGKKPDYPKDLPTANLISGKEAKLAAATAQVDWLETAVRPKFAPTDSQLAALGQARADAVKQALLADAAIDPARVFVATGKSVTAKGDDVQMELAVK